MKRSKKKQTKKKKREVSDLSFCRIGWKIFISSFFSVPSIDDKKFNPSFTVFEHHHFSIRFFSPFFFKNAITAVDTANTSRKQQQHNANVEN